MRRRRSRTHQTGASNRASSYNARRTRPAPQSQDATVPSAAERAGKIGLLATQWGDKTIQDASKWAKPDSTGARTAVVKESPFTTGWAVEGKRRRRTSRAAQGLERARQDAEEAKALLRTARSHRGAAVASASRRASTAPSAYRLARSQQQPLHEQMHTAVGHVLREKTALRAVMQRARTSLCARYGDVGRAIGLQPGRRSAPPALTYAECRARLETAGGGELTPHELNVLVCAADPGATGEARMDTLRAALDGLGFPALRAARASGSAARPHLNTSEVNDLLAAGLAAEAAASGCGLGRVSGRRSAPAVRLRQAPPPGIYTVPTGVGTRARAPSALDGLTKTQAAENSKVASDIMARWRTDQVTDLVAPRAAHFSASAADRFDRTREGRASLQIEDRARGEARRAFRESRLRAHQRRQEAVARGDTDRAARLDEARVERTRAARGEWLSRVRPPGFEKHQLRYGSEVAVA